MRACWAQGPQAGCRLGARRGQGHSNHSEDFRVGLLVLKKRAAEVFVKGVHQALAPAREARKAGGVDAQAEQIVGQSNREEVLRVVPLEGVRQGTRKSVVHWKMG